jgi:hypothetical protein
VGFLFLFNRCSNYRSIKQPNRNHTTTPTTLHVPNPPCHLLRESSASSLYASTSNSTSSEADAQHPHIHCFCFFFELPVALAAQALLPHVQHQVGGILSVLNNREALVELGCMSGGGDRDAGNTHVRAGGPSSSSGGSSGVIENGGDWHASRMSLRLAVGLQCVMENSLPSNKV